MRTVDTSCRPWPSLEPLLSPCLDTGAQLTYFFSLSSPVESSLFTLLWGDCFYFAQCPKRQGGVNNFRMTLVYADFMRRQSCYDESFVKIAKSTWGESEGEVHWKWKWPKRRFDPRVPINKSLLSRKLSFPSRKTELPQTFSWTSPVILSSILMGLCIVLVAHCTHAEICKQCQAASFYFDKKIIFFIILYYKCNLAVKLPSCIVLFEQKIIFFTAVYYKCNLAVPLINWVFIELWRRSVSHLPRR